MWHPKTAQSIFFFKSKNNYGAQAAFADPRRRLLCFTWFFFLTECCRKCNAGTGFENQLQSAGPCVAVCLSGLQTPARRVAVSRLTFDTLLPSSTPLGLRATADGEWESLSSLPIRQGCRLLRAPVGWRGLNMRGGKWMDAERAHLFSSV